MIAKLFPLKITFPAPMTKTFPLTVPGAIWYNKLAPDLVGPARVLKASMAAMVDTIMKADARLIR